MVHIGTLTLENTKLVIISEVDTSARYGQKIRIHIRHGGRTDIEL